MIDPRIALDEIVALISRDIAAIKESPGKLDHQDALDLVRYSGALLDVINRIDIEKKEEKDKLSKLTGDELRAKVQEILNKTPETPTPTNGP